MQNLLKNPFFIWFIYFLFIAWFVLIKTYFFPNLNTEIFEQIGGIIIFISIILLFIKKLRFIWKWILLGVAMSVIFWTLFTIIFISLWNKVENNTELINNKQKIYNNQELGWTIEVPKGWKINNQAEKDKLTKKWLDVVEWIVDEKIDIRGLKNLISFQKNKFNIFQSTSEPFENQYEWEWKENNANVQQFIYDTYVSQWIKVDTSEIKTEKIDGLDFEYYTFTIYNNKNKVVLQQIIYSRLINGLDFGVVISYNNESDKNEMLNAWINSKFNK